MSSSGKKSTAEIYQSVYSELRNIAHYQMSGESSGHTLQPTALINETYLRLVKSKPSSHWQSREDFLRYASEVMRNILVDNARAKKAKKRGGGLVRVELSEDFSVSSKSDDDLISLDEALTKFESAHPVKSELVKLRYFGGLTFQQAAEVLGISKSTAINYWNYGKAWLLRELTR